MLAMARDPARVRFCVVKPIDVAEVGSALFAPGQALLIPDETFAPRARIAKLFHFLEGWERFAWYRVAFVPTATPSRCCHPVPTMIPRRRRRWWRWWQRIRWGRAIEIDRPPEPKLLRVLALRTNEHVIRNWRPRGIRQLPETLEESCQSRCMLGVRGQILLLGDVGIRADIKQAVFLTDSPVQLINRADVCVVGVAVMVIPAGVSDLEQSVSQSINTEAFVAQK